MKQERFYEINKLVCQYPSGYPRKLLLEKQVGFFDYQEVIKGWGVSKQEFDEYLELCKKGVGYWNKKKVEA